MVDEFRQFIAVGNYEAVKLGDLSVTPGSRAQVQEAAVREETDMLTLRIRYHECGDQQMGGRGLGRTLSCHNLHYKFVVMNKEVTVCHPSANSRAKTLCKIGAAGGSEV